MSSYISQEELLEVVSFMDPRMFADHVVPQLDETSLMKAHEAMPFNTLPIDVQDKLQDHLLTRSLSVIKLLDTDNCFDRQQLFAKAKAARRIDVIEYLMTEK